MTKNTQPEEPYKRSDATDLHQYVQRSGWPLGDCFPNPSLVDLKSEKNSKEQISLYLTRQINRSLERHIKAIGISKQQWIEHAILLLLEKEQKYFTSKNKAE